jgi:[glutamine synthetase] adenylyltransferase / [glutamine synthetase]-adenylyl-L-tyrosine phosphorylase
MEALETNPIAAAALLAAPSAVRDSLPFVFSCSDFVAQACVRDRSLLHDLLSGYDLQSSFSVAEVFARAPAIGNELPPDDTHMLAELRRWRQRALVRIAWRDLMRWATLEQTLAELSAFADAAIEVAARYARRALVARYGEPRSASGESQPLVVIAMGKLGGGELNFSSDVDLVMLFPESGETVGAEPGGSQATGAPPSSTAPSGTAPSATPPSATPFGATPFGATPFGATPFGATHSIPTRSISNEEFFTRLGQGIIRLLETPTHDGFVLRVDMRLRPFGDSGPLVSSFASFEDYLPRHGRDWERYAYVKARAVTARDRYAELYASAIRPFVYRRYLDYGVFESLREMKALIEREVERRDLADNVKLGPGGIREIEFIVQAFQLIRGGRDKRLQTPSLLAALAVLERARSLPPGAAEELRAAYVFLRDLENRLQMLADTQEHRLPTEAPARERVARSMGMPDWPGLLRELDRHRANVSRHFRLVVFGGHEGEPAARVKVDLGRFWESQGTPDTHVPPGGGLDGGAARGGGRARSAETAALGESLSRAGFSAPEESARLLLELRESALVRRLDEAGRKRLQALLPALLHGIATAGGTSQLAVLRRILRILEAIGQRSAYFALLHENRTARERLIELCGHGEFLANQIAAQPILLDELLGDLSQLPERGSLAQELDLRMAHVQDEEPERQVEALRHFQSAAVFRVAVADLSGRLPVMRVSDRLTEIAELILERAMQLAWHQITQQFGTPECGEGAARRPVSICAVGYGKLGGIELSYSSDLDLVFLHDSRGERQETSGARPIDNQLFFVRLAQRIVHLLTMHSAAGRLYEVDVRLRPSGKGGMLVTNIHAFAEYQRKEAWTWEHQALLHARAVAGAAALRADFEAVRLDVLCRHVRHATLREDVRNMRERMRKELSKSAHGQFDIKQDAGGVADVEFLAQYWALEWAGTHPPVALFSDTIRQLESVASADLVAQETVDTLTGAYRAYRTRTHHLALAGAPPIVPEAEFAAERAAVTGIWDRSMATPTV